MSRADANSERRQERRGCWDCGWLGGSVEDVYDSEGEWAGSEWVECPCQRDASGGTGPS
jgi:hypothetical protein